MTASSPASSSSSSITLVSVLRHAACPPTHLASRHWYHRVSKLQCSSRTKSSVIYRLIDDVQWDQQQLMTVLRWRRVSQSLNHLGKNTQVLRLTLSPFVRVYIVNPLVPFARYVLRVWYMVLKVLNYVQFIHICKTCFFYFWIKTCFYVF